MSRNKKIALGVLVFLVVLQFVPMTVIQEEPTQNDLMNNAEVPAEVAQILKKACYDCHSHQTNFPWYAKIQPVGFWINGHTKGGRQHLNFSEWGMYDAKQKAHKLEEICEEIEEAQMPLKSYTWLHEGTRLNDEQVKLVCDWTRSLQ